MSIFGKIGHGLKKVGKAVGGVAEKAAPFVGLIPGVGTLAAAGIGAGGALLHGDGLKGALKYGAEGAIGDIGQHFAQKIPGVGKLFNTDSLLHMGGGGSAPVGAQMSEPDMLEGPGGIRYPNPATMQRMTSGGGGGGGGGVMDWLKSSGGGDGGTPNWMKVIGLAGGLAGTVQNARQTTKQNALTDEQIAMAREAIKRQRELQDRALTPINVAAPDYTSIFAQTQNPFYQRAQ